MSLSDAEYAIKPLNAKEFHLHDEEAEALAAMCSAKLTRYGDVIHVASSDPWFAFTVQAAPYNCGSLLMYAVSGTTEAAGKLVDLYARNLLALSGHRAMITLGVCNPVGKVLEERGWTSNWASKIHGSAELMNYCCLTLPDKDLKRLW